MNYVIPKELKDALIVYLSTRPYAEVAQPIALLQQLKPEQFEKEKQGGD